MARLRSPLHGYATAAASVALATVVRMLLDPYLAGRAPFITFFFAVAFTAWCGRLGPTLVAVLLSVLAADFFLVPPVYALFPWDAAWIVELALFVLFGGMVVVLCQSMRRQADQADQQRQRFRVTLASIGDGVIVTDGQERVTFMNPVAQQLTGWKQSEAEGRPLDEVFQIVDQDSGNAAVSPLLQALQEGRSVGLTENVLLVARDGTRRAIEDSTAPIRESDGRLAGAVLVFRDVSEKRTWELQRGRLAAVVDSSDDAILVQSLRGVVTDWNEAAERLFGYAADEVIGKPIFDTLVPPDRRQELIDALKRVSQGEIVNHFETMRRCKNGRIVPVSIRISPIRDAQGRPVAASAIDRDISRQRAAERRRGARLAVMQILAQPAPVDEALPRILALLGGALEWDVACLWRVQSQSPVLRCEFCWKQTDQDVTEFEQATRELAFRGGDSLPGRVWQRLESIWVPDVAADPGFRRAAQAKDVDLHGGFACPIMVGSGFYGVIEFFSRQIQQPDEDLLEMMATIGNQIGRFIERGEAEKALQDSERLYHAIGESIDFGVWVCSPDGKNIYLSESFLRLVGRTQEQCTGYGWLQTLHPDDVERTKAAWQQCVATMGQWDVEHRIRGADGGYHPVLSRGVPVRDEQGEVVCWAGINLDVSRMRQAEDALREADRRKNEFLAMLAHELRNPLAPIRSGLDVLALEPGHHQQTIELMQDQVTHIVRLVDDLLDVSRIMRGRVELRKQPIELADIVRRSVNAVGPLMQRQQQELIVDLPEPSPWLDADPVRLTQVIENLLTNAAKYSLPGGRVELTAVAEDDDLAISVKDTGMGIEADLLPMVFELFTQSPRSLDRSQGGLGIGLTLVRNLVEMHGGSVTAHSEGPGHGSTFVIRLPLYKTSAQAMTTAPLLPPASGLTILLVDDNRSAVWMLSKLIKLIGDHRVETAADGPAALEMAHQIHPDMVLLDIGLPGMDGLEVARRLRQDPALGDCLLVALTGYGQEEDRRRTRDAGFDEHLVKPPSIDQIRSLLADPRLAAK